MIKLLLGYNIETNIPLVARHNGFSYKCWKQHNFSTQMAWRRLLAFHFDLCKGFSWNNDGKYC